MDSQPLPHPLRLEKLLRSKTHITATTTFSNLPRLSYLNLPPDTQIKTSFEFNSEPESQYSLIKLTIIGQLSLKCQRCMEPMTWEISHTNELIAVTEKAQADLLSDAYEPILCEDGYVDFTKLVEDELLLLIPQIPIHSKIEDCNSHIHKYLNTSEVNEKRPFSVLKELISK